MKCFPCVIKPFLSGSRGVMRVNTKKELSEGIKTLNELLLDELRKRGGKQSDYIMIEEYIPEKKLP